MNAITFDTLSIAKRLKAGGFTEPQAEALAHEIQESSQEDHLVTRDFLRTELEKVEMRMTIRVGGMIIALGSVLIAIKYFG